MRVNGKRVYPKIEKMEEEKEFNLKEKIEKRVIWDNDRDCEIGEEILLKVKYVEEFIQKLKEDKKRLIDEFDHFCKCCDFARSALDNRAIVFMNDVFCGKYLDIDKLSGRLGD